MFLLKVDADVILADCFDVVRLAIVKVSGVVECDSVIQNLVDNVVALVNVGNANLDVTTRREEEDKITESHGVSFLSITA